MALKKGSPNTVFLKWAMMKMIESGQLTKLITKYESGAICELKEDESKSLSYQKLFLLYVVIVGGMVLSVLVLIFEVLKRKKFPNDIPMAKFAHSATQTEEFSIKKSNYCNSISKIPRFINEKD